MSDFEAQGADQMLRLSKALKQAGRTGLRKELNKGLKAGAKPLVQVARRAFREGLPSSGGAGKHMAKKTITPVVATGKDPGVKIRVGKTDPRLDSEGRLAHPVFNRRNAAGKRIFVVQKVQPGVFSDAMRREAPSVRPELEKAIERVAETVVRAVR